ncbi:MAG: Transcriptional regulatory protein terminal [Actinomycetota bacterium]|jgi:DNA-binding response OmpR family regulator|nr:Transcriptional regulatory protein terminal [Actinomycetota bacterium]
MQRPLTPREEAVYDALRSRTGRIVSRQELVSLAKLGELSPRRVDSVLVGLRDALGSESIITVRGRGWRLRGPDE